MNRVFINDARCFTEDHLSIEDEVKLGNLSPSLAKIMGLQSVAVSKTLSPADLARNAIARLSFDVVSLDRVLFLHAAVMEQGLNFWPSWAYVAQEIPAPHIHAFGLSQMSSGGVTALALAGREIKCQDSGAAVIATSDCFGGEFFDRWHSDHGTFYGDAGTALVLSSTPGPIEILSWYSSSDNTLESLYRGASELNQFKMASQLIDVVSRSKAALTEVPYTEVRERMDRVVQNAVSGCLDKCNFTKEDVDLFLVPYLGRTRIMNSICKPLEIDISNTSWEFGRTIGHIGCGDQIAYLEHLMKNNEDLPYRHVLIIGIGAGYSATCILCKVIEKQGKTK